jgi:hypothetical protein
VLPIVKSSPTASLLIVSFDELALLSVIVPVPDMCPSVTVPKFRLDGESVMPEPETAVGVLVGVSVAAAVLVAVVVATAVLLAVGVGIAVAVLVAVAVGVMVLVAVAADVAVLVAVAV